MQKDISLKNEILRKLIHFSTAFIPLAYHFFLNTVQIQIFCGIIFGVFLLAELFRINITQLRQFYEKYFGRLLRPDEKLKVLNGATLLTMGFFFAVLLFDKKTAIIVMLIVSIADTFAAIVGKKMGKIMIRTKTLEGSIAFFISSFAITMALNENLLENVAVATLTTIVELTPLNDNISIPITGGITFFLMQNI